MAGKLLSVVLLLALVCGCGKDHPPTAPTPAPATLVGVAIEGPAQRDLGARGQTLQLRAIAIFSDGSRDVTNDAAWSAGDARVLSVSPRGLVTGLTDGTTTVTATYRERAGVTSLRVADELRPRFLVNGVLRDADRGTPIVGGYVYHRPTPSSPIVGRYVDEPTSPRARTDGNGFFQLGALAGGVSIFVNQFGYEQRSMVLPSLTTPASLDIRLQPDTAPYIERTLAGEFDGVDDLGLDTSTMRISTRGSGVFDAIARARSCEPGGSLSILVKNAGFLSLSPTVDCDYARLRFVLKASDVHLTIEGHKASGWELIYREPR